jgi:hypothetical protein
MSDQTVTPPLRGHYQQLLALLPSLPDTAIVPVPVVAVHEGTSRATVKRTFPLVQISPKRFGVRLGLLRARHAEAAA